MFRQFFTSSISTTTRTTTSASILRATTPARATTAVFASRLAQASRVRTQTAPIRGFRSTPANMTVHEIKTGEEFKAALEDHKVVLVDFFATWCAPCKAIAPKIVEWSEKYPNIHYLKVDVDELPQVSQEYGIRAMPTFFLFKDGEKVDEVIGAVPPKLQSLIEQHHPAA